MQYWKTYVKAGNSLFTVENATTGERYTYKIKKCDDQEVWFVRFLFGPDNTKHYRYLGTIFGNDFQATRKTCMSKDAKVFAWFKRLNEFISSNKELPSHMRVYHTGSCGRCGRTLTVPASVEAGFGPECILHVGALGGAEHFSLEVAKKVRKLMLDQQKLKALMKAQQEE